MSLIRMVCGNLRKIKFKEESFRKWNDKNCMKKFGKFVGIIFAITLTITMFSTMASAARVRKDVEIFACNYCGEKFDSASALNEHGCIAISTPDDEVVETGEEKPTAEHKVETTESTTKPETKTEPVTEPSTTKPAEKTKDAVEEEVTEVKVIAITEPETRPVEEPEVPVTTTEPSTTKPTVKTKDAVEEEITEVKVIAITEPEIPVTPEVPEEPHVEIPVEPTTEPTTEPEIEPVSEPEKIELPEIKVPELSEIKIPDLSEIKVPDFSGIASNMLDVELPGSESKKSATNQIKVLGTEEALIAEVPDIPFTGSANSPLWACTSLAVASGAAILLLKRKKKTSNDTEAEED